MVETDSFESQDSVQGSAAARRRRRLVGAGIALALLASALGLRVFGVIAPKPCASCHGDALRAGTQASAHASVECRSCHISPGAVGQAVFTLQRPLHAYFTLGHTADRDAASVPDTRCKSCHENAFEGVTVSNGIRISHASCAVASPCTDCHSSTAHGSATRWVRSYDMDGCLECHIASNMVGCDLCHKDQVAAARIKSITFAVTHGPKWKTTHAMGDTATCTVCHVAGDCADCHGAGVPHEPNFVDVHTSYAAESNARCASCHEDEFCDSCHGTQMPHPAGFTPRHVAEAKKQPDLCTRCHEKSDCTECHLKHVHPGGAVGKTATGGGG